MYKWRRYADTDTDSSKFQRRPSCARKSVDTFILSDVNAQKSKPTTLIHVSDKRGDLFAPENHQQSHEKEQSLIANIMQCLTLCD